MTDTPPYRQIGIIGTGRVARALGRALAPRSAAPILVWGRDEAHAEKVARAIGGTPVPLSTSLSTSCDLIVLAVADDALEVMVAALAAGPPFAPSALVVHVSGRSGAAPLAPLGAMAAAIHPVMTFTGDPAAEVERMRGARFAVTGIDEQAAAQARALVALLGGVAVDIAERHRALYHAALCHAANHLVTLLSGALDALAVAGVDDPGALLAPLASAALDNSLAQGFAALSGPLLRGDRDTIDRHLDALAADSPDLLPAYRAMALATLDSMARHDMPAHPDIAEALSRRSGPAAGSSRPTRRPG